MLQPVWAGMSDAHAIQVPAYTLRTAAAVAGLLAQCITHITRPYSDHCYDGTTAGTTCNTLTMSKIDAYGCVSIHIRITPVENKHTLTLSTFSLQCARHSDNNSE
eukprot:11681-Heterococcus_DN1.PRE.4